MSRDEYLAERYEKLGFARQILPAITPADIREKGLVDEEQ